MSIINSNYENKVKKLAQDSMNHLEPICQSCWDNGKDDPLGLYNGVNTPYNKAINTYVDEIIDNHPEADYMWSTDIREELIDIFYKERRWQFNGSSRKVNHTLECYYCYLERKNKNGELSIRISDIRASDLLDKSPEDWL